jgi:hypothetical protein
VSSTPVAHTTTLVERRSMVAMIQMQKAAMTARSARPA